MRSTRDLIMAALIAALFTAGPVTAQDGEQPGSGATERLPPASYLKLHPDFVVNLKSAGAPGKDGDAPEDHALLVTVQVMSRNAQTLELAFNHLPALRHRMLMLLADQVFPAVRDPEVQRELQTVALAEFNQLLHAEHGSGHVLEGVYFTEFVIE